MSTADDPRRPDEQTQPANPETRYPGERGGGRESRSPETPRRRKRPAPEPAKATGPAKAAETTRPPRRRHKVRRWTLRGFLVLLVLLILAFIGISLVLRTGLPKRIVLQSLQKQFGLRVNAESLAVGWTGRTELKDVTMSLPLAKEALLTVPEMRVKHTNLVSVLLGRPVRLQSVELRRPRLVVVQDSMGRWNVQEAMALITRATGGKGAADEQNATKAPIELPKVALSQGTVVLTDNKGKSVTLEPFELHGEPKGPLVWDFRSTILPDIKVEGSLAPAQDYAHRASFVIERIPEDFKAWFASLPAPVRLEGDWNGKVKDGMVNGRAELRNSRIENVGLAGAFGLKQEDNQVLAVTPDALRISNPLFGQQPARFTSGAFRFGGTKFRAEAVRLAAMGGTVRLDGEYNLAAATGAFDAGWADLAVAKDVTTDGELRAEIEQPFGAPPQVKGTLASRGSSPRGKWDTRVTLLGTGPSYSDFTVELRVPDFHFDGTQRDLRMNDLLARVVTDGRVVSIRQLRLGDTGRVNGFGRYDLNTRDWWVSLDLNQIIVPNVTRPVDLLLDASGSPERIDVMRLEYTAGKSNVWVGGAYVFDQPKPLSADLYMWRIPLDVTDPGQRRVASGGLRGEAHAEGTLYPMDVDLAGRLFGNDVFFGRRSLGDVRLNLEGHVDGGRAVLKTTRLKLLDGQWAFSAQYLFDEGLASLDLDVAELPVRAVDALLDPPSDAEGVLTEAKLRFVWPRGEGEPVQMDGTWALRDLVKENFAAKTITGRLEMRGDDLVLPDVELRQEDGIARGTIQYNLRDRSRARVELAADNWPLRLLETTGHFVLNFNTNLDLNLKEKSATGPVKVAGSALLRDREVATFNVSAVMEQKTLRVDDLRASGFGGTLAGNSVYVSDDWPKSTGHLEVNGVDARQLVEMWPRLTGLYGTIDGVLHVSQNMTIGATEPLRAELRLIPRNLSFHAMSIKRSDATLVASRDRLILQRSQFRIADGLVTIWGRLTKHDAEHFGHVQVELNDLSINEVVHAVSPRANPQTGRVTGEITAYGPPQDLYRINGEGNLRVSQSGLLDINVLRSIFFFLNPGKELPPPAGRGHAAWRLEAGRLSVVNMFYRNRDIYVRGSGEMKDVWLGADSPITGYAIGTARPLNAIKLPLVSEFGDLLEAIQSVATTFRIDGTAKEPALRSVGLNEAGDELRKFFVGDIRSEVQGSAGR